MPEHPKIEKMSQRESFQQDIHRLLYDWFADPNSRIVPEDYLPEGKEVLKKKNNNKYRKNWFQAVIALASGVANLLPMDSKIEIENAAHQLSASLQNKITVSPQDIEQGDALLQKLKNSLETF